MIVIKTALGMKVMQDRSMHLTPQQRSALILVDGKRSAEEIVRMTAAVGVSATDLETLASLGLIEPLNTAASVVRPAAPSASATVAQTVQSASAAPQQSAAEAEIDFPTALNAAIMLCSDLGFKGFGLNIALTGVDTLEKLQKLAPEIRKAAGDKKYAVLHPLIFGRPL